MALWKISKDAILYLDKRAVSLAFSQKKNKFRETSKKTKEANSIEVACLKDHKCIIEDSQRGYIVSDKYALEFIPTYFITVS